jgi:protein O-mannosyl-transferase
VIKSAREIFNQHFILVIALALTFAVYFKFLFYGHISWDDPEMVFRNRAVRDMDLKTLFTGHFVGNYIPVTMLVHALGWLLFDSNDAGHHFINILLHLLNGVLTYIIARRLFKNNLFANITTIIFLLHPMQIESVGWIGELKNVLSSTFYLAAIICYLGFTESKKQKQYLFTLLFFTLGCLSKSSVVVLPLSLICFDIYREKNFSFRFLVNKIPFLILSVLFGLINLKTQSADLFINYSHAFPYHERLGYAGFAIAKYIITFIFPFNLSVLYPYPQKTLVTMLTGYCIVAVILFFLLYLFKRKSWPLMALILLCVINLILVLQFIPFGEVLYADRYMYLPLIFFSLLFLSFIQKLKIEPKFLQYVFIAVFSVMSFLRVGVWKSGVELYSDILKKFPDSFVALNSLGTELMFSNQDDKALHYLNKAVAAAPKNYKGYYNRGLLLLKSNKPEAAIKSFNQSLEIYNYPKAYVGRAAAYYALRDLPKAMNDAAYVLQTDPGNTKARFVLANCYNDLNKLDEAMDQYNQCIRINSEDPDFYFKRAIVFGKKQDFLNCLGDLNLCIEFNPAYFEAYYWRGVAKVNLRQNPCEDFKIAARNSIQPAVTAFNKYCQ